MFSEVGPATFPTTGPVVPFVPGGVSATMALYVPAAKPVGFTLTLSWLLEVGVRFKVVGLTVTNGWPVLVVTDAVTWLIEVPLFPTVTD